MNVDINWWGVVLATLSSMVVGSIWYARGVFGNTWARLAGVNMDRRPTANEMTWLMGLTLVASFITAYVLAHFVFLAHAFFKDSWMTDALTTAFWAWLGFTACRIFTHDIFEGRRKKLTLLNWGNELVTLLVMGFFLGLLHP